MRSLFLGLLALWSGGTSAADFALRGGLDLSTHGAPAIGADVRGKWAEIGLRWIGSTTDFGEDVPAQTLLHATGVIGRDGFMAGIGAAYLADDVSYPGGHFAFRLLAEFNLSAHFSMAFEHYSCAWLCEPNHGRNLLTMGWRFK